MKNIIIAGPPRAGKSTLARKINEQYGHFAIGVDKLAAAFGKSYPQLDIRLNWNREKTTDNIAPFLGNFLDMFSDESKFVLEGAYFNFEIISSILNLKDKFILIGLVQNNKTVDEFVRDLKKYDTKADWTYGFDDDELREIAEVEIPFSREMTDNLTKYGFTIYDTSTEREQVFDEILADIKLFSELD